MCVDRSVARRPSQIFADLVWDVLALLLVFLRESKIDHIDDVGFLAHAQQQVVWLYVAMQDVF